MRIEFRILAVPNRKSQIKNQKLHTAGIALIGLIGAILIMALLGAGLLMLLNTGLLGTLETAGSSSAFFAAETGISVGKAYIATNSSWYTNMPYTIQGSIGGATYSSVINSTNAPVAVITSTGRKDDAKWTSIWEGTVAETAMRALVGYRQNNSFEPCYRTYWSDFRLGEEEIALSADSNPQWQRIAASPLTNEFLLVSQNSSRWIWGQVYTNGIWYRRARLNEAGWVPVANARGFDVAYENLSGRGLVVYSIGTATPQYRTWNGVTLSLEAPVNVGATHPIRWVRLVPRPRSNEIMLLARWRKTTPPQRNYSSAIVWNGSTWTNLQPLETNCASEINYETMDAAWSTNSAIAVYINGNTAAERERPKYRTYTASGWSGENPMTTLGAEPRWMRVEFGPDGTNAVAGFLCNDQRLKSTYWNGSGWQAVYVDFGRLDTSTERDFDIAWNSQTNMVMVTYCKRNTDTHSYMLWTVGSSPIYGDMAPGTTDGRWSVLKSDPFSSEFLYMSLDDKSDINVQRWNGVSWVLLGEVEDSSNTSYDSLGIAYRRDIAP